MVFCVVDMNFRGICSRLSNACASRPLRQDVSPQHCSCCIVTHCREFTQLALWFMAYPLCLSMGLFVVGYCFCLIEVSPLEYHFSNVSCCCSIVMSIQETPSLFFRIWSVRVLCRCHTPGVQSCREEEWAVLYYVGQGLRPKVC